MPVFHETLPGFPDLLVHHEGWDDDCSHCQDLRKRLQKDRTGTSLPAPVITHIDVNPRQPGHRPTCPTCARGLRSHGTIRLVLHDLPRGRQPVVLHLRATDWRCPGRCTLPSPFNTLRYHGARATKLTRRLHDRLLEDWLRGEATRTLARRTALLEGYLRELVNEALGLTGQPPHPMVDRWRRPELLSTLRYVGIDDLFWRQRPLVVVVDLRPDDPTVPRASPNNRDHRLLDVLPSRDPELVRQFLRDLDQAKALTGTPGWRPAIATDMWGDFRVAIQQVFQGRAVHVTDRFHLSAKILEDLHDLASEIARQALEQVSRAQVSAAYLTALRDRNKPSGASRRGAHPPADLLSQAVEFAVRLQSLWDDQTPLQAIRTFQRWREEVTSWGQAKKLRRPFGRLIHLLDREGWLLETVSALRPEARPALSLLSADDLARLEVPAARPTYSRLPGEVLLSTARVERLNRRIRELERRSPNHRRAPVASTDWRQWGEEVRFRRYRARLLFALNTRPRPPERLLKRLVLSPDVCCGSVPEVRWAAERQALDVPLMGARVTAQWQEGTATCARCGGTQAIRLPEEELAGGVGRPMRAALEVYLLDALGADHALTTLEKTTGVPVAVLRTLRARLREPQAILPQDLGALPFFWRRRRCMLITDIRTGRPVELLRAEEGDFGPEDLQAWLVRPECAHVQQVWVEKPEWIPEHVTQFDEDGFPIFQPVLPRRALDPFASARLLQRRLGEVLQEYTAQMDVGLRRARRKYRLTLVANPDERYWSVDERRRRPVRQEQWSRLTRDEGLQYGLLRLQELKQRLREDPDQAPDLFRRWSDEVTGPSPFTDTTDPGLINRLRKIHPTLNRTVAQLAPDQAVTEALVLGLRLAHPQEGPGLTLARSRRRLRDLRELSVYRGSDWTQLRRVALTRVGHD